MAKPIVDLKRSVWDKKKSDPSKGEYVFEKIVYYRNRDFAEGYIHPYKLKWCKYSENDYPRPFSTFNKWKMNYKATPVTVGDDYWPEGFVPDNSGYYVNLDLILVKIPIEEHMKHRKEAVRRSEMAVKNVKKNFVQDVRKAGIEIDEDMLEEELDRRNREFQTFGT